MGKPVVCDLYARVSTADQAEEGFSLGEQESRLRAFADSQGWTVNAFISDPGFSGAKLERPGIQRVIADAKAHKINKLVTYKLDRLSRSQKDTLYLIEDVFIANEVDYVSMTESLDTGTPLGMAMIGILSVFAQLERQQIAERMTMGRIASAKEGNWRGGGGVPIGYRYIPKTATAPGQLVIDEYEALIVKQIFQQFLSGKTYHAVYDYCRENYTTSYGRFGSGGANLIPSILRNQVYIGKIKYCGEWYQGHHEAIIDEDTFHRTQAMLIEYQATLDDHRRKPFVSGHLLTGLLWCGDCGARWAFRTNGYKNKAGVRVSYDTYTCYTRNSHKSMRKADKCSITPIRAAELERVVLEQVRALRYEDIAKEESLPDTELNQYQTRLKEIEKSMIKMVDLYTSSSIPFDILQARSNELNEEKEKLQALIDTIRSRMAKPNEEKIRNAIDCVDYILDNGDDREKRDLLLLLIKKITINKDQEITIEWNI